jgi:RND superfamily putative drug exporter
VIILVILMLLLRSLVAPWYLMLSVGLGFGATLGATVPVFQVFAGQAGLVFLLPVYMYLFVVALGTDELDPAAGRVRRGGRHRAGGVRHGDVLLAQPHRSGRQPRLMARPSGRS